MWDIGLLLARMRDGGREGRREGEEEEEGLVRVQTRIEGT